jgi:hypothetical protein
VAFPHLRAVEMLNAKSVGQHSATKSTSVFVKEIKQKSCGNFKTWRSKLIAFDLYFIDEQIRFVTSGKI